MPWLRMDDQFPEHPKIVGLSDRAFRLHTAALCYCARNLTDGQLDKRAVKVIQAILGRPVNKAIAELVTGRVWHDHGHGEYAIHGYLERNPDAEKVKTHRANNADRQRRWRETHNADSHDQRNASHNASRNGAPSQPISTSNSKAVELRRERPSENNLEQIKPILREMP